MFVVGETRAGGANSLSYSTMGLATLCSAMMGCEPATTGSVRPSIVLMICICDYLAGTGRADWCSRTCWVCWPYGSSRPKVRIFHNLDDAPPAHTKGHPIFCTHLNIAHPLLLVDVGALRCIILPLICATSHLQTPSLTSLWLVRAFSSFQTGGQRAGRDCRVSWGRKDPRDGRVWMG